MIKVFGTFTCPGCLEVKNLLDKKNVEYQFYNIQEDDGLAELAVEGLADELSIPIVTDENGKVDLDSFVQELNSK